MRFSSCLKKTKTKKKTLTLTAQGDLSKARKLETKNTLYILITQLRITALTSPKVIDLQIKIMNGWNLYSPMNLLISKQNLFVLWKMHFCYYNPSKLKCGEWPCPCLDCWIHPTLQSLWTHEDNREAAWPAAGAVSALNAKLFAL